MSIEDVHNYDINIKTSEIYLVNRESQDQNGLIEQGINFAVADRFIKNMHLLRSKEEITIHMNLDGGDIYHGLAIYDTIKTSPKYITIISYNTAASMSSIILQAADVKVLAPHAQFMFHKGRFGILDRTDMAETYFKEIQKDQKYLTDIYVTSMQKSEICKNWSYTKCKNWLERQMRNQLDVYLSAQEAIKYGFVDEVLK